MKRSNAYERARERIEARRGFIIHAIVYVLVSVVLVVVNLASAPETLWFKWPLMGWGVGLLFHGFGVFVSSGRFAVTDEMVEREMSREHAHDVRQPLSREV